LGCVFLLLCFTSNICAQSLKMPKAERTPVPGSATYFPFSDIAKVIQKWSPSQHLYVQGNLSLSQSQLMGLETWIHQKGPHWTVILMEDASLQRYTNREGRIETGMDAFAGPSGHRRTGRDRLSSVFEATQILLSRL
jgi:hypothetical protein